MLRVIVRADSTGPFAIFPEIAGPHWTLARSTRGPVSVPDVMRSSREVTTEERAQLLATLGPVKVVKRETPAMRRLRFDVQDVGVLNA